MKTTQLLAISAFTVSPLLGAVTVLYEPSHYFSEADSPFIQGINQGTIYLEDFEDQALNTPFITAPTDRGYFGTTHRARFPNIRDGIIWGVDGDDGLIDGQTFAGDTFTTINSSGFGLQGRMHFEFQPNLLGQYPTYVGVVITQVADVDRDLEIGFGDQNNSNVISDGEFDPKTWRPPGGATAGDPRIQRFIGVFHSEGITSFAIGNVFQIDHLQYGYAIPEPTTAGFLMIALALLGRRRR